jgi:hypothetical protein
MSGILCQIQSEDPTGTFRVAKSVITGTHIYLVPVYTWLVQLAYEKNGYKGLPLAYLITVNTKVQLVGYFRATWSTTSSTYTIKIFLMI